ncbi:MAG: hypothetical protein MJA83_04205, partial [Gammaproteobacteria bacterium]|nr:hypothetical protein [Gammaproteobacteria bacterium]
QNESTEKPYPRHDDHKATIPGPWTDDPTKQEPIQSGDGGEITLFTSDYLNYMTYTRLHVMQDVLLEVIDELPGNTRAGIMRFVMHNVGGEIRGDGGVLLHEIAEVKDHRDSMKAAIEQIGNEIGPGTTGTPLAEALVEAARYFKGDVVRFGEGGGVFVGEDGDWEPRSSVPASRNAPPNDNTYKTPIEFACQVNHIAYLSDGGPSSDGDTWDHFRDFPNYETYANKTYTWDSGTGPRTWQCSQYSNECLPAVADYIRNEDISSKYGNQNIITHTIGFQTPSLEDADQDLLKLTAQIGGGESHFPNTHDQMLEAFRSIIRKAMSLNASFTAPAVSVNAFNRARHKNDLFFTIFKPENRPHWDGNLKKY